jgi:hypothetical protein
MVLPLTQRTLLLAALGALVLLGALLYLFHEPPEPPAPASPADAPASGTDAPASPEKASSPAQSPASAPSRQAPAQTPEILDVDADAQARLARLNGFGPDTGFAPPNGEPFAPSLRVNSPQATVEDDLAILHEILGRYREVYGRNPVGTNAQIMSVLAGINPRGWKFMAPTHPDLGSEGLVDRWGTPFHFHALSAGEMEVRSGGPDGELWTADDAVYPPRPAGGN